MAKKQMKKKAVKVKKPAQTKVKKKKIAKQKSDKVATMHHSHEPPLEDKARWSLNTLIEAEEIRSDKKLMKAIEKEKKKREKALKSV